MGIDIISLLHCISITNILYVADQSVSPNSIENWEIFSAQWQFYNTTNHLNIGSKFGINWHTMLLDNPILSSDAKRQ